MIDKKSVASGTTCSSVVKNLTIGSAITLLERIMPHTNRNTTGRRGKHMLVGDLIYSDDFDANCNYAVYDCRDGKS